MSEWTVHTGDCLEVMAGLDASSVDAIVTDPPYGLAFMGKAWDHAVPGPEFFAAMLRVAKPGAHLVAFGGTRLYHRMTCAIEDAGWEVRDCLMWLYGSGFPKSHDVSKAIDREAGAEREVVGSYRVGGTAAKGSHKGRAAASADSGSAAGCFKDLDITAPATLPARQWQGWGTALKPAWEPIVLARKPLDGTVAANHLRHGCGGLNVDGCRVGTEFVQVNAYDGRGPFGESQVGNGYTSRQSLGRWPANLILDAEAGAVLGEAARFFYCPKASKADRDEGLEGFEASDKYGPAGQWASHDCFSGKSGDDAWKAKHPNHPKKNTHPTVKPTDLMRYLARLVTPTNGTVLDPFTGSGSTGKAAVLEGFNFIGIEREPEYADIARARIAAVQPTLIGGAT